MIHFFTVSLLTFLSVGTLCLCREDETGNYGDNKSHENGNLRANKMRSSGTIEHPSQYYHRDRGLGSRRWRQNRYFANDGILPYQRCNATEFFPGPKPIIAHFSHARGLYSAVFTAVSVWGTSDVSGEPKGISSIELLMYYKENTKLNNNIVCPQDTGGHCLIVPFHSSNPMITCSHQYENGTTVSVNGNIMHIDPRDSKKYTKRQAEDIERNFQYDGGGPPTVSLVCPFSGADMLRDEFLLDISIGDGKFSIDICYEQVDKPTPVVICSQPHFGFKNPKTARFWFGSEPPFRGHSLIDSFVLFHTKLLGARVVFQSLRDEFLDSLERYRSSGDVMYRSGWVLSSLGGYEMKEPDHGFATFNYLFQNLAESTCVWENRFRAKLFAVAYGVDNYALPIEYGQTLASIAEMVNLTEWSAIEVPMVEGFTPKGNISDQNVLKRWSLLGREHVMTARFTPLGDPRCVSYTMVHTISGHLPCFRKYATALESIEDFKLHSLHLLALARPERNSHKGQPDPWFSNLASQLESLLEFRRKSEIFFVELHVMNEASGSRKVEMYMSCSGILHLLPDENTTKFFSEFVSRCEWKPRKSGFTVRY